MDAIRMQLLVNGERIADVLGVFLVRVFERKRVFEAEGFRGFRHWDPACGNRPTGRQERRTEGEPKGDGRGEEIEKRKKRSGWVELS
mmetsp:Transcript_10915/g.26196  ORF Transcript_10915/g.26196 Transcript_10915/m.26196 type:complete len:87 (+) Transcript_10915:138-398(+)